MLWYNREKTEGEKTMKTIPLGSTGLRVTKTAMGCLPLQRCEKDYAV